MMQWLEASQPYKAGRKEREMTHKTTECGEDFMFTSSSPFAGG